MLFPVAICRLAARKFAGMGYPVMELEGGFDEWKGHDLEIEIAEVYYYFV